MQTGAAWTPCLDEGQASNGWNACGSKTYGQWKAQAGFPDESGRVGRLLLSMLACSHLCHQDQVSQPWHCLRMSTREIHVQKLAPSGHHHFNASRNEGMGLVQRCMLGCSFSQYSHRTHILNAIHATADGFSSSQLEPMYTDTSGKKDMRVRWGWGRGGGCFLPLADQNNIKSERKGGQEE